MSDGEEFRRLQEEVRALRRDVHALRASAMPAGGSPSGGAGGMSPPGSKSAHHKTVGSPSGASSSTPSSPLPGGRKDSAAKARLTFKRFVANEMFGVMTAGLEQDNMESQSRLDNFLHIPAQLEHMMTYGVFVCLDAFLHTFTVLPLRALLAVGAALLSPWTRRPTSSLRQYRFRRTHAYDIMRGIIMFVVCRVLSSSFFQFGVVYHTMKTQSAMKLYVVTAMVEISDKLLCSLGQDILDSLYYTTRYHPHRYAQLAGDFLIANVFMVLHAGLFFLHVVSLEVAMNHKGSILLTLLISNNFAELKTSVFKKFTEGNLYQITCADIVERFKLIIFLLLILFLNFSTHVSVGGGSGSQQGAHDDWSGNFAYFASAVLVAEVVVDWVKHAFITKFNKIRPSVYRSFSASLCRDLVSRCRGDSMLDHTHAVSRRLGLVALPLACLVVRFVTMDMVRLSSSSNRRWLSLLLGLVLWLSLCFMKMLTSILLLGNACRWIEGMDPTPTITPPAGAHGRERLFDGQQHRAMPVRLGPVAKIEQFVLKNTNAAPPGATCFNILLSLDSSLLQYMQPDDEQWALATVAAEEGFADAQFVLADCYMKGLGVEKNHAHGIRLIRESADQGHARAQNVLGVVYSASSSVLRDVGVEQDDKKAAELWHAAAAQGHAYAQFHLAECYVEGRGVAQDEKRAVELFAKAAEQRVPGALVRLGAIYAVGAFGVKASAEKAVLLLRQAADLGFADAQFCLGACYMDGKGVEQDYAKAAQLYSEAAEQGHADAQYWLGMCYAQGKGVEEDGKRALQLWCDAALQGHTQAQNALQNVVALAEQTAQMEQQMA
eukprot:g9.t1